MVARRSESGARRQSRRWRPPRAGRAAPAPVRSALRPFLGAGTSATASVARAIVDARDPSWKRTPEASSRGMVTATRALGRTQPAAADASWAATSSAVPCRSSSSSSTRRRSISPARSDCSKANPSALAAEKLLDVGEDRLAEGHQRLGVQPGLEGVARHPAQGDPGPRPVGGEQAVEGAPLADLAAPEGRIHQPAVRSECRFGRPGKLQEPTEGGLPRPAGPRRRSVLRGVVRRRGRATATAAMTSSTTSVNRGRSISLICVGTANHGGSGGVMVTSKALGSITAQ